MSKPPLARPLRDAYAPLGTSHRCRRGYGMSLRQSRRAPPKRTVSGLGRIATDESGRKWKQSRSHALPPQPRVQRADRVRVLRSRGSTQKKPPSLQSPYKLTARYDKASRSVRSRRYLNVPVIFKTMVDQFGIEAVVRRHRNPPVKSTLAPISLWP